MGSSTSSSPSAGGNSLANWSPSASRLSPSREPTDAASSPVGHAAASWAARLEAKRFKRSAAVFSAASSAACFVTTLTVFKRKHIRLATGRYQGRNLYFVTLCFHNRRRFGANPCVVPWLIVSLRKHAAICSFFVHAYCVMPDHMHLLAAGASDESNLIKFIESFKQETAFDFARRTQDRKSVV